MTSQEARDLCRLVAINKGLDTVIRNDDNTVYGNVVDVEAAGVAFREYADGRRWLDPEEPRWAPK